MQSHLPHTQVEHIASAAPVAGNKKRVRVNITGKRSEWRGKDESRGGGARGNEESKPQQRGSVMSNRICDGFMLIGICCCQVYLIVCFCMLPNDHHAITTSTEQLIIHCMIVT